MAEPMSLQVPAAVRRFQSKYAALVPQYGESVLAPLMQMDYNRAIRGAYPIPDNRTPDILKALQTGQTQFAQEKEGGGVWGFLNRFRQDVGEFARALPKLPATVVKEAVALKDAPKEIAEALQSDDKLNAFGAPGLRLLPGSAMLEHGLSYANEHPFFAAMDVMPYTKKLVPPAGRLALEGARRALPELTGAAEVRAALMRERYTGGKVARGTSRIHAQERRRAGQQFAEHVETTGQPAEKLTGYAEDLQESMRKRVETELGAKFGESRVDLEARLRPLAQFRARKGADPEAVMNQLIDANYIEWGGIEGRTQHYVPKQVDEIAKHYFSPRHGAGAKFEQVMRAYRNQILPWSPRFHAYNAVGGGVMVGARTGPGIFKHVKAAYEMTKHPDRLPVEMSRGFVQLPARNSDLGIAELAQGAKTANMFSKSAVVQRAGGMTNWLYNFGEKVDTFYRSLAYLYGNDKALTKGMTKEASERAGIELSNKMLQDWDAMVPLERQVIRTIFPFYGWMHHIAKYAATYPIDHPLRASITANFARAEIEDWDTGLPTDFQNYLMFPDWVPGVGGKGLNLRGSNPFSDVGGMLTFAGFFGQVNPIAGGMLEAAGINTMTGRPDLYPDVEYDEQSGRLVARQPNIVEAGWKTAQGLIPSLPAIRGTVGQFVPGLGPTNEEKQMRLSNPEAYNQMLFSSVGIPGLRTVNKDLEIAQAEAKRADAMQAALTRGMKTGDFTDAKKYDHPGMKLAIAQLEQMRATGQLDQYRIQGRRPGITGDPMALLRQANAGG